MFVPKSDLPRGALIYAEIFHAARNVNNPEKGKKIRIPHMPPKERKHDRVEREARDRNRNSAESVPTTPYAIFMSRVECSATEQKLFGVRKRAFSLHTLATVHTAGKSVTNTPKSAPIGSVANCVGDLLKWQKLC